MTQPRTLDPSELPHLTLQCNKHVDGDTVTVSFVALFDGVDGVISGSVTADIKQTDEELGKLAANAARNAFIASPPDSAAWPDRPEGITGTVEAMAMLGEGLDVQVVDAKQDRRELAQAERASRAGSG